MAIRDWEPDVNVNVAFKMYWGLNFGLKYDIYCVLEEKHFNHHERFSPPFKIYEL